MWPFKSKARTEFKVVIIRQKISITHDTYIFKSDDKRSARTAFLLWWYRSRPLTVDQDNSHIITTHTANCNADFLKKADKKMLKRHLSPETQIFSEEEQIMIENLELESKYYNI